MNHFKYLTINENGVFVGGKPTKFYNGAAIAAADLLNEAFLKLQEYLAERGKYIKEVRILASETEYKNARPGANICPSSCPGPNVWYCYVLYNKTVTKWRFYASYDNNKLSTSNSAYICGPMACMSSLSGYSLQDASSRTYTKDKNSLKGKIKSLFGIQR